MINKKLIKKNKIREVYFCKYKGKECILKVYINNSIWDKINNIFFPKALKEKKNFILLEKYNIPIPNVLKAERIKNGSKIYIEKIEDSITLKELCYSDKLNLNLRIEIAKKLAIICTKFHNNHIFHEDFHFKNILVRLKEDNNNIENNNIEIFIIDLYKIKKRYFFIKNRILKNLAEFGCSFFICGKYTDYIRFINFYLFNSVILKDYEKTKIIKKLKILIINKQISIWNKKFKKNITKTTEKYCKYLNFCTLKGRIIKRYISKVDELLEILINKEKDKDRDEIIKDSRSCYIVKLKYGILKVFRLKKKTRIFIDIFRGSRAKRAWIKANKCISRYISTSLPLFYIEIKFLGIFPLKSFILMEEIKDSINCSEYLKMLLSLNNQNIFIEKKQLLKKLAKFIKNLHYRGISHRDMKLSNFLIDKNKKIYLIDMEGIKVSNKPITEKRRKKDILRLVKALRKFSFITWLDIWRFIDYYMPFEKPEKKLNWLNFFKQNLKK